MVKHDEDDHALIEAGYIPQLKRSLGGFSSFAIPFSEMSITTGIFANFGFVLTKAGPFGFWTWLLVSLGQTMVALVLAEMAGRIPLAGSIYNWNNKLANPMMGWLSGWLLAVAFAIGTAGVTMAMLPVIGVILGYDLDPHMATTIAVALILVQLIINLYGARLTSQINIIAVVAEIISMVGLGLIIIVIVAFKGHFHWEYLTTVPSDPKPYWPGFLMASLLAAWTIIGFECSADVSEETINAKKVTPKGMIFAVLLSVVAGFAFIVVMTVAIPNLKEVTDAPYPLATIITAYLGSSATNLFLAFVLTSIFACSMVVMMTAARVVFAMSRDNRFIAAKTFKKVSAHHVPKNATILIAMLAVVFILLGDNLTLLSGAATVCAAVYYLITVIGFGIKIPKMDGTNTFSLGIWHWPVVILAALWIVAEIAILTVPEDFHPAALTAGAVILSGILLYPLIGRPKKKSRRA